MADNPSNPKVTKKVMQQYERLRGMGVDVMDRNTAYTAASRAGFQELADLIESEFNSPIIESVYIFEIIKRRAHYMRKFKLKG